MHRSAAYRRHQFFRARGRAKRMLDTWDSYPPGKKLYDIDPTFIARYAITRKPCSCPGCGNERRHFGTKTLQELKHEQEAREQLSDDSG